ncbi:ABC transporter permease [Streptomyces sp. ET3-23]|uniref:ABC transporter permease n=1 Tax=Streptomyces sp. ET3-23 TaxID=2885643 RepID=UPI001D10F236|nr:ABC transporter permease [Streptomyces sp. ET3-23]MCC2274132.1 ABC transporter permease [Streptomyces sp. ET3-23]
MSIRPQTGGEEAVHRAVRGARRDAARAAVLGCAVPLLLLSGWEAAARTGVVDALLFPPPSRIAAQLAAMTADGELGGHLAATLGRLLPGYVLGALAGALTGFAMGVSVTLRAALGPLFAALYCLPKIATLPLLLLVFGLGETPKVLAVAITVFFVTQINTLAGVRRIDTRVLETARSYGASGPRLLRFVLLPGAAPAILTGLRTAVGLAVVVVVAVEFVASDNGLGFLIWNSWTLFRPDRMYVGLVTVAVLGAVLSAALAVAERWLLPWQAARPPLFAPWRTLLRARTPRS